MFFSPVMDTTSIRSGPELLATLSREWDIVDSVAFVFETLKHLKEPTGDGAGGEAEEEGGEKQR
jgi:hypothetical protein